MNQPRWTSALCLGLPFAVGAIEIALDTPWWLTGGGLFGAFVLASLCWPIKKLVVPLSIVTSILIGLAHLYSVGTEPIPLERHMHCVLWIGATLLTARIILQRTGASDALDQFFSLSPDTLGIAGVDGALVRINEAGKELFELGQPPDRLTQLSERFNPQDLPAIREAAERLKSGLTVEGLVTRVEGSGGSFRSILWTAVPDRTSSRVFAIGRDVSQQVGAQEELQRSREALAVSEESLRNLNVRLTRAAEDERRRIARELHDGVSQRLALIANSSQAPGFKPEGLAYEAGEIAEEVRRISHRLHPAILDNVGLEAALEAECQSFHRIHGIRASCEFQNCPVSVTPDVALALYRITQEALSNVARHAKASWVKVTLTAMDDRLVLSIVDSGIGFEPENPTSLGGLGLVSMRERARQIGAHLAVSSQPGKGTEVEVEAPTNG